MDDKPPVADRTKTLTARVTPELHKQVKLAAIEADLSMEDFVRRAVSEKMARKRS
jgi:predicted HicB family RNase H-like nuclease